MPKGNFIPGNDNAFSAQLKTFKLNIGGYAATIGVNTKISRTSRNVPKNSPVNHLDHLTP